MKHGDILQTADKGKFVLLFCADTKIMMWTQKRKTGMIQLEVNSLGGKIIGNVLDVTMP